MSRTPRRTRLARLSPGPRPWLLGLLTAALVAGTGSALAQSPDEAGSHDHPVVGAWIVTDELVPEAVPSTTVAHADGTVVFFRDDGPFSGVWEPTGERSATVTLVSTRADGVVTLRAKVAVAADGESFSATYTAEPACICGDTLGQFGPGSVAGSRIHVDPPGEPVGPLAALEPSPDPAASPVP